MFMVGRSVGWRGRAQSETHLQTRPGAQQGIPGAILAKPNRPNDEISNRTGPPTRRAAAISSAIEDARGPKKTAIFSALFPLDGSRRLRSHVIDHAVDALHLIDDPRRHAADESHVERIEIGGHAVGRG